MGNRHRQGYEFSDRERNEGSPTINMPFWPEVATSQTAAKAGGTLAEHRHLSEFRRQRAVFKEGEGVKT